MKYKIATFDDFKNKAGDLLRYLVFEHDTLRVPSEDSKRSRWSLHPLWLDLQQRIEELNNLGISHVNGKNAIMEERLMRISISILLLWMILCRVKFV
jgi:hypothetical protein